MQVQIALSLSLSRSLSLSPSPAYLQSILVFVQVAVWSLVTAICLLQVATVGPASSSMEMLAPSSDVF